MGTGGTGTLKRVLAALAAVLIIGAPANAGCSPDVADLRWPGGQARFHVEVAQTNEERARGLMHRASLAGASGMLFVYDRSQPVAFWMRNTLIPLDMLFIEDDGRVLKIHENARPLDETPIPSDQPVRYVLEINGGLARKLGLKEGAALRHPSVLQDDAIWPCE